MSTVIEKLCVLERIVYICAILYFERFITTQDRRRSKEFYAVYLGINPSWPKVQGITIKVADLWATPSQSEESNLYLSMLKGLFADFTWGVHRTSSLSEIRVTLSVITFFIPLAAMVDFIVSRNGPIVPLL